MKKINLKSIVYKEEKFYVAQSLNVDVSSFGETKKQALSNLTEALELYFEDMDTNSSSFNKVERPEIVSSAISYA